MLEIHQVTSILRFQVMSKNTYIYISPLYPLNVLHFVEAMPECYQTLRIH